MPFFVEPNFDTQISALEGCYSDENPIRYPEISAGEYLLSRFAATYEYREKFE